MFFNACAQLKTKKALTLGKKVFNEFVIKSDQSNDLLYSALYMFIKCEDLKSAESLFDRVERNIVLYGSMMKLCNNQKQPEKTMELFQRMKMENFIPDDVIFVLVIDAISTFGDLSLSQSLIDQIPEKFLSNSWIQVGLIDLWVNYFVHINQLIFRSLMF